jgi:uncharacterized protein
MTRSYAVDILRGAALLGIGIVNLPYLAQPLAAQMVLPETTLDLVAKGLVSLLYEGKFFVLFSFLFGWGFGVQLASAARAGLPAGPRYRARLIALALFGVAHALLVFPGDILLAYAMLGAGLWSLREASPRRLWRIALWMVPLAAMAFGLLGVLDGLSSEMPQGAVDLGGDGYRGSFAAGVAQRLSDWPITLLVVALFNGPLAFGAFCLGLAAQKLGFFDTGKRMQAKLAARLPLLLAIALPANGIYAAAILGYLPAGWPTYLGFAALALGAPALGAVYVLAVLRLAPHLGLLAPVGSMPLTGYIGQGVLAGAVFHGWGLGLFGTLGNAALFGVACLIWLAVTGAAILWQRRWARGPLDAAWRATAAGLARSTRRHAG